MKRSVSSPFPLVVIIILLLPSFFLVKPVWSNPIYSYSDMPSDKITLFPDFPNTFQDSLTSYGISTLRPAGNDGIMNFYAPSTDDDLAPFGKDLYLDANTFTFTTPVFAVGFTFIATDYPNSDAPGSFDNNVQDVSHEVRAYDKNGNLIENVFSSSWTIHIGPRHFYIGGGIDFVASYAGIWSDTPIYSVSFGGIRPSDGVLMATYGSFSFSRTPLHAYSLIDIDIKPGEHPNSINPKSKGKIPVAIISSKDFDALSQVDQNSLTFGRSGDEDSLAFCHGAEDVNRDGLKDLVCHFYTKDTGFQCGDTKGILKGKTKGETIIKGSDSVKIVPCK